MKFGLNSKDIDLINAEISSNLGHTKNPRVFIFGSRAKGTHRKYSDIDLLLKAESYDLEKLSKMDFSKLDIPYVIDFVLDKDLFEEYRQGITSDLKPFEYQNPS